MPCKEEKKLLIITGPTAVGKSDLAIKIAQKINGEIISADSCQVYKYMDIGSAKIKKEEMQDIRHYLIDCLLPDEEFNVSIFKKMALEAINEIYSRGKIPIIVGGTGFYIQALLYDINFEDEPSDNEIREELTRYLEVNGNEKLHNLLKECDYESSLLIHPNNAKRVIRAIEYFRLHNSKISEHNENEKVKTSNYDSLYVVLNAPREQLYANINKRVDIMMKNGLVDEVCRLIDLGYDRKYNSMQAIGYKEVVDYLDGIISYDECVELIKKNTRHFAKRQLTWFRREKDVYWIDKTLFNNEEDIVEEIFNELLQ